MASNTSALFALIGVSLYVAALPLFGAGFTVWAGVASGALGTAFLWAAYTRR